MKKLAIIIIAAVFAGSALAIAPQKLAAKQDGAQDIKPGIVPEKAKTKRGTTAKKSLLRHSTKHSKHAAKANSSRIRTAAR
jgi:hypothetical protein